MKRLLLVLTLALALAVSPIWAASPDDICTMIQGSKVIQIMPNKSLRGVLVPYDVEINIGPEINETMINNLNSQTDMDWTGGNVGVIMIDQGRGLTPIPLVVKDSDVKDCK